MRHATRHALPLQSSSPAQPARPPPLPPPPLAGKAGYGTPSGTITVNGKPDRLERYKRVTGFVPQDDIMHRALTVEEVLKYSAAMRLPASADDLARLQVSGQAACQCCPACLPACHAICWPAGQLKAVV